MYYIVYMYRYIGDIANIRVDLLITLLGSGHSDILRSVNREKDYVDIYR